MSLEEVGEFRRQEEAGCGDQVRICHMFRRVQHVRLDLTQTRCSHVGKAASNEGCVRAFVFTGHHVQEQLV